MKTKPILILLLNIYVKAEVNIKKAKQLQHKKSYEEFDEHTVVTDSEVFPYVVALLKKSSYLGAGALIDEKWVVTDADSLYFTREAIKMIRIRLGSINYKKGGEVRPIKLFHIHPYFDDKKPLFDIALVRMAKPVRFTSKIYPIRLRKTSKDVVASHFIVTSWSGSLELTRKSKNHIDSMDTIKRRRLLTVTHLHPTDPEDCKEELFEMGLNSTRAVMCLDPGVKTDPCVRDVGAPVVLNGILRGIVSSWKPKDCEEQMAGPSLVTLVSEDQVSTWLYATIHGQPWEYTENMMDYNELDQY